MNTLNRIDTLIDETLSHIFSDDRQARPHKITSNMEFSGWNIPAGRIFFLYLESYMTSLSKGNRPTIKPLFQLQDALDSLVGKGFTLAVSAEDLVSVYFMAVHKFHIKDTVYERQPNFVYTCRHLDGVAGARKKLMQAFIGLKNHEIQGFKSKHDAEQYFDKILAEYCVFLGMTPKSGGDL